MITTLPHTQESHGIYPVWLTIYSSTNDYWGRRNKDGNRAISNRTSQLKLIRGQRRRHQVILSSISIHNGSFVGCKSWSPYRFYCNMALTLLQGNKYGNKRLRKVLVMPDAIAPRLLVVDKRPLKIKRIITLKETRLAPTKPWVNKSWQNLGQEHSHAQW